SSNANNSAIGSFGTLENNDRVILKDVDGNGVAEALYLDEKTDGTFDVRIYTLNTQGNYVQATGANLGGYDHLVYAGIEGDINGDGITDFITSENQRLVYFQFDENLTLNRHVTNFYFTAGYDRIYGGQGLQVVDVDSDGYQDILFTSLGSGSTYKIAYYRNKGNGNVDFTGPYTLADLGSGNTPSIVAIDLDGDGLIDFGRMSTAPELSNAYFSQRNSSGVLSVVNKSNTSMGVDTNAEHALLADLNGDGLKDYVFVKNDSSGQKKWHAQINKGNRTFASAYSLNTNIGLADMYSYPSGATQTAPKRGRVLAADVDGDGAEELMVATHTNDDFKVVVVGERLELLSGQVIDFIEMCVANDELYVKKAYSKSCGLPGSGEPINIDYSGFDMRRFYWSTVDFKTTNDVLTYSHTKADVAHAPLNGFKFLDGTLASPLTFKDYDNDGYLDLSHVAIGGFSMPKVNGEVTVQGLRVRGGFAGSFSGTSKPVSGMYLQKNAMVHTTRQSDTLYQVSDGLNVNSEWYYAPISRPELVNGKQLYTVPANRDNWYTNKDSQREHFYFTSSMPVVTNFRQSNGVGGTNQSTYRYKEAIYNRKGRGFQGFRTVIIDSANGTRSVSDFHQIFPLAGKVEQMQTCLQGDNSDLCSSSPLSKTEMGYASVDTTGYGTYWNIPAKTIKTSFELNGRAQVSKTTSYVGLSDPGTISINMSVTSGEVESRYGNIKQSTSKVDTGFGINETQTVSTFYGADENNWWIGKLDSSAVTTKKISQVPSSNAVYNSALDNDKTVTTHIDVYDTSRQPKTVRTVPSSGKTITANTVYNSYGLPTSVTTTADSTSRSVSTGYSSDYYFVDSVTNINGTAYTETNPRHGQPDSTRDINGFISYFKYDAFGRVEEASPPSGTGQPVYTRYALCQGGCDGISDSNLVYKVTTYSAGTPETSVYKDQFNRALYSRTKGFNGSNVYS
ncbi:MAG: FG-GAP-like repeat-containing protein, partial [Kangiellaceae bacterium]|nr:FG-GAP-like repeat-containing protein [Kangiellaceae bacterium]